MIVLKIILFIILTLLALVLLILLMPVRAEINFIGNKFFYSFKIAFIEVVNSKGGGLLERNKSKKQKKSMQSETQVPEKDKSILNETPPEHVKSDYELNNNIEAYKEYFDSGKENYDVNKAGYVSDNEKIKPDKNSYESNDSAENKPEKTIGEKLDFLISIWKCAKHPIRRILKGFHISSLYIDFIIANEDAYKCAVKYGRIGGLVYHLLAVLSGLFTVKFKTVDVTPGFGKEKSRWDAGCKIWFLPITAVIMAAWFGITFLFKMFIPSRRKNKKQSRKAE